MKLGLFLALCAGAFACAPPKTLVDLAPPAAQTADPIEARFNRAASFESEGRLPEAVMELREIEAETADNDPRRLRVFERLGMIYLDEREWEPAHEAFLKALKLASDHGVAGPEVADSYAGIGLSLSGQGKFYRAAQYLRRGLELGPNPEVKRRAENALERSERRVGEDPELEDFGPEFVVTRISVDAKWTEESIIRGKIPFREGDTINGRDLAAARAALYRMNMFKSVDVSTAPLDGGVKVSVTVKDGWYLLPLPMIAAGAGSGRGGIAIEELNAFSQAESMSLQILRGQSGSRTAFTGSRDDWTGTLSRTRQSYGENIYADGGYSASSGLGTPLDANNTDHFGPIQDSYGKRLDDTIISINGPISRGFRGEWGFDQSSIGYFNPGPTAPPDNGRQGNMFGAVRYGSGGGGGAGGLGGVLGYGMAGLDDRIKPLRRPQLSPSGEFRVIEAGRATKSSFGYGMFLARAGLAYSWGQHESVSFTVAGGHGASLPDGKLIATGRATALQGTYAREYRGPTAAGATIGYSRWLVANHWGVLQGGLFAEDGRAWFHDVSRDKQGVGVSMFFRFWRFPLPLGVSYTYSIDDRNALVSGAVGGRF